MADSTSSPEGTSPELMGALSRVPDRAFAGKLEALFAAASGCIAKLRAIDLSQFESDEVDGAADLGLWELLAPTVGATLGAVNELTATIRAEFPEGGQSAAPAPKPVARPPDDLDAALADMGLDGPADEPMDEFDIDMGGDENVADDGAAIKAADGIRMAGVGLQQQVAAFGMGVRNPEVVASRWNLLMHLQGSIGRFNQAIGDMVFDSLAAFGIEDRHAVPFHKELLKESLSLRRAMVDLSRVALLYVEKLKGALLSEMPPLLAQLEKDLASFSKTTAYKTLWAQDKREMMAHRAALREVAQAAADAEQIRAAVVNFSGYTSKLGAVNERAILREHDLALATQCAAKLEEAELMRLTDVGPAAEELVNILREAWSLYGRDAEFDAYLRRVKKRGNMTFTAETLAEEMEQVQRLISRVPLALLE